MAAASVLLAGCGPKQAAVGTGPVATGGATAAGDTEPPGETGLADTDPLAVDTAARESGLVETGAAALECQGMESDPDAWVACCDDLRVWCEETFAGQEAIDECVFGPDYDGSTGCIPWGPPAPPAFAVA